MIASTMIALLITASLLPWSGAAPAQAGYVVGGSGIYKGDINWLEWGTADQVVPNGKEAVTRQQVGDDTLITTCRIDGITGSRTDKDALADKLRAYRSGDWRNDGLDNLYNTGGVNTNNRLIAGLSNINDGDVVDFKVFCTATLSDATGIQKPVQLSGLVIADAEASNANQGEYVQAQPLDTRFIPTGIPSSTVAEWRVIERFRQDGCTFDVKAERNLTGALKLAPTSATECNGGPMAIGYMQGATAAKVTIKGGGKSAVALGVIVATDYGDAPMSYNSAGSLYQPKWSGTPITSDVASVFSLPLPTMQPPTTRLGATVDSNASYVGSVGAIADDATGSDEDAITPLGTVHVRPNQQYTLPNVTCTGPGFVAGWIDWNANGAFDTGERSAPVNCVGGKVSLGWTVPSTVKKTASGGYAYLRLRIAVAAAELDSPIGLTTTGEVEDHAFQLNVPTLTVQKNVTARAFATDQFNLTMTQGTTALGAATTMGSATGVQGVQVNATTVQPGTTYAFAETMTPGSTSPASNYTSSSQCTVRYLNGTSTVLPVQNGTTGTVTVPAALTAAGEPAVNCVFTNTPKPASVLVKKVWNVNGQRYDDGTQPAGLSAQLELSKGTTTLDAAWNSTVGGYSAGDQIGVTEAVTIAPTMPGCVLTSQILTGGGAPAAGASLPQTLSLVPDLVAGTAATTATVTNTVNCTTTLTLTKQVVGGSADPQSWTLSALLSSGAKALSGTSAAGNKPGTATGTVTPGTTLQLAEAAGSPEYVQDDTRTAAETSAAPLSTGSWACTAVGGGGVVTARMGLDGTVTPTLGSSINCIAVNQTARLSLLKVVENANGTGSANPAAWDLTVAPNPSVPGLVSRTVPGAATLTGNTVQVRPGHDYTLSEDGKVGGYVQKALQRFTGTDPNNAAQVANPANWVEVNAATPVQVTAGAHAVYRFINRDAAAMKLPLTGGGGPTSYLLGAAMILGLALVTWGATTWRRKRRHP